MNKLTAFIAVGALAVCTNASETVTLKRDILGRAIGTNQKQPVLLKNTKVQKAAPSAFTFMGPIYNSIAELYNPNEAKFGMPTTASFVNDYSTGYQDEFVFNNISGLNAHDFEEKARSFEEFYRHYEKYASPGIAIPASYNIPYDYSSYDNAFHANAPTYQQNYVCLENGCYMTKKFYNEATGLTESLNNGYWGVGVSIHVSGKGFVVPSYAYIQGLTGCQNSGYRGYENYMENSYYAAIIKDALPFANIYSYDAVCDNEKGYYNRLPDEPWTNNMMIGIHTYSASGYQNNPGNQAYNMYGEEAAIMDEYIYRNRVAEFTTMTGRNNYGASINAISVAGINAYNNSLTDHEESNPRLPSNQTFIKPELANYTYLHLDGHQKFKKIENNGFREYDAATSSDGAAATLTATMAAGLLSVNPFYKWHPEVVKALMISAAEDDVQNNRFTKSNYSGSSKVLMGMRHPTFSSLIKGNRSRYWIGDNECCFENEIIKVTEKNLVKGKKYRLAIAWLNSGAYTMAKGGLQQDIDLVVKVTKANGATTRYSSNSSTNGFEVVEFVNSSDKDVEVEIKRYTNNGGRVLLGYNLHEVE